jgi:hypothetical protein
MNRSENDILFDCQEDILLGFSRTKTVKSVMSFTNDYKNNNGEEVNNNFSHDNWLGIACWGQKFSTRTIEKLPVFGRHSLRPDNFAFFFWVKHRRIGYLFMPIYYAFQIFDLIRMRKDHEGIPHTSGLLLNYFAMTAFKMDFMFWLTTKRVEKYFGSWLGVFERYYNQPNNIRVLEAYKRSLK